MNNFILAPCDTDSISICKSDMSIFTKEEQDNIIKEINSIFPDKIVWAHDGFFPCIIVLKTKNYILYDGTKIKMKGSSLKDQKKEKILKMLSEELVWAIINNTNNFTEIYHRYIKMAMNITDISLWSRKVTISDKVLNNERTNESKIRDAIEDSEYVEGDKAYIFFKEDESLGLAENFDGKYNKDKMLEKLYKATKIFNNVLSKDMFLNYSLKKNKKTLEELIKC